LAARRLRFLFHILSFMAPSTDFLLPRFETYGTGENADYGTLLTAVQNQRRAISALGVGPAPSGNRVAPTSSSTN
jgi:hypothetical protein